MNFWPKYFDIDRSEQIRMSGMLTWTPYHGSCPACDRPYTILHKVCDPINLGYDGFMPAAKEVSS